MSLPPDIVIPPPGPRSRELSASLSSVECPAFDARRDAREAASGASQLPIVYARGQGANVWDVDGNRYVDLAAGFGALIFGHSPPALEKAVSAQEHELLLALGDVYASDVKVALSERLVALFPEMSARVMLGLSGADALTAALKTVALTGRPRIVAFEGSYHGLSYAPLAACGLAPAFRDPFREHTGHWVSFETYPSNETIGDAVLARLRALAGTEAGAKTGAVLIEPALGRGGIVEASPRFLRELRALCTEAGWLLVVDEVFTGMGRSGALSLAMKQGILPDILCLGKGLGAGRPISAMLARDEVMRAWGDHGGGAIHTSTHFGAPGGCAAALEVLRALSDGAVCANVERVGEEFRASLAVALSKREAVVRGRGLMIGVDLGTGPRALRVSRALLERGYVVVTGGRGGETLTLTPPLDIEGHLLARFATVLGEVVKYVDERG